MDKVSIVIPVYNNEKYVKESIESALNQTYQNTEVIAIDDGSTDKSPEILKKYSRKIKIFSKKNGGTSSALNAGIKAMTGEWFKWLGGDDVLLPNAVEELMKVTKNLKNKEKFIIVTDFYFIDSSGKLIGEKVIDKSYAELDNFHMNTVLLDHFFGNPNASIIYRSALAKFGGFDGNFNNLPDYELWLRYCLLNGVRILSIPKFLLKTRIHQDSISSNTSRKKWAQENDRVRKHILSQLDTTKQASYLKALKEYQKSNSSSNVEKMKDSLSLKKYVNNIILKFFSEKHAIQLFKLYRKITRSKKPILTKKNIISNSGLFFNYLILIFYG